jgi:Asp-tRNA(Asn)/Glu-tRNA(Gln) amidotransferase A subunit family amidase
MIQQGLNTRVGPMCRTVEDTARILDVIAGYDSKDDLTAFSVGRMPPKPSWVYAKAKRLDGMRIGVLREFGMDKSMVSSVAHYEGIDLITKAVDDLRALGATIVDPGPGNGLYHGLFQSCVDQMQPEWRNSLFVSQFPALFPAGTDQIPLLVSMFLDPTLVPHTSTGAPSMRSIGPAAGDSGGAKFNFEWYLRRRGDPGMQTVMDLATKSNFYDDPANGYATKQTGLLNTASGLTYSTTVSHQQRFAVQTMMFKCFADKNLDAIVYPSNTIPPRIMGSTAGAEPSANDWGGSSTFPSNMGFPAITVPAGYTTVAYDRNPDGTLRPPIAASLPIGVEFLALPFMEHKLFAIAGAYEAATHHRVPPADYPALP